MQIITWEYEVLIARLHSGHHPALQAYLHQLDPDTDSVCPTCKEEGHTLHHWLTKCPAGDCLQQKVFGCPKKRLEWLTTRPKAVVVYTRKTLVNLDV